jgi:clathrin heavy chain
MTRGYFEELISLLESGIGLERAHMGIFTALGEMYANHAPPKLMEHLKLFCTRVNIPRLISICERQMLWKELTFLYEKYDEFDNALDTMMLHDATAWEHVRFKDVAVKCSTVDIFYKAIQHYFDMHPDQVNDLLKVLEGRIDHNRVVSLVRRGGYLGASKDYLIAVQKNNLPSVNEAVNEVLIEEDDYEGLEASVESYDNFDQLKLAEDLEV